MIFETKLSSRFKLHLRPKTKATASISDELPPLPRGKTAVDVFADFLSYLNRCARSYIEETHVDGASLLASGKVEFILSHPNAWEGAQQTLMRNAAIQAGLISGSPNDRDRVHFISEGEASLNFCIDKNLTNEAILVSLPLILPWSTHRCVAVEGRGGYHRRCWWRNFGC